MEVIEILKAWKNVAFTTEEIEAIAKERMAVCSKCPHKTTMMKIDVCGLCHSPLLGKTHSPENSCPKKKWLF
jgi:hypothetical protein